MPWKESCAMSERARFCQQAESGHFRVAELCCAYGISRVTGYKWLERYRDGGVANLADRSRARHTQSNAYPASVRELVVEARELHPNWGAKKIGPWLAKRHAGLSIPSCTTMETMLREAGLVRQRRRSRRLKGGLGVREGDGRVNGVWAVDFKGEFRLGNRTYCYPLTVTDSCSRFLLMCRALPSTKLAPVRQAFEALFGEFGLPDRIRSDNGVPFASAGVGRLSRLSVYWMTLGIEVERTRPGHPQDNGRHERMHRTLAEDTTRPPARTQRGQQRRFGRFRSEFNEERPHEALDMRCPSDVYEASERMCQEDPFEYPGHFEERMVSQTGQIWWNNKPVFLSSSLAGQRVGLEERDEGVWAISFRTLPLGRLLKRKGRVCVKPIEPGRTGRLHRRRKPCG